MSRNCPNCGVSLDGGSIWEHFYNEFRTVGYWKDENGKYIQDTRRILSDEEAAIVADEVAENYGATRTEGQWGRQIGQYCYERDRTISWECPDCGGTW